MLHLQILENFKLQSVQVNVFQFFNTYFTALKICQMSPESPVTIEKILNKARKQYGVNKIEYQITHLHTPLKYRNTDN